jgi:hypothetical protein
MLARRYWFDWMGLKNYEKYPTLNSYVEHRVTNENLFKTVEEAKLHFVIQACKELVPYDQKRFGDYPEILEQELHNPKYQVIYRDGQIIGRNDILD